MPRKRVRSRSRKSRYGFTAPLSSFTRVRSSTSSCRTRSRCAVERIPSCSWCISSVARTSRAQRRWRSPEAVSASRSMRGGYKRIKLGSTYRTGSGSDRPRAEASRLAPARGRALPLPVRITWRWSFSVYPGHDPPRHPLPVLLPQGPVLVGAEAVVVALPRDEEPDVVERVEPRRPVQRVTQREREADGHEDLAEVVD